MRFGKRRELRGLVAGNGHGQAVYTAEENQGCGIHRTFPGSAQRFLTTFLVFYRQPDSPGWSSPAQEQVPKEGETQMALPPKCRSAIEVPVLPRME